MAKTRQSRQSAQSRQRRVQLARAREAAGLTQEAFAGRAGVEVSTVVRWESGCTTPLPGKRPQIARALGVGLHDLERLLTPDASQPVAMAAVTWEKADAGRLAAIAGVREDIAKLTAEYEARPATGLVVRATALLGRVEALRSAGAEAGGGVGVAAGSGTGSRSGLSVVPENPVILNSSGDFLKSDDGFAAASPLPDVLAVGAVLAPVPPTPPAPLRWRRDLDVAEAEAALIIGRLLWDAAGRRDSAAAEEFFDRAARRAGQAGDSVLQVTATLRAAFVGLYGGDPRAGVRRCVQAAVMASPVSEALFALARLHAAEGHARLGHAAECDRALTTARGAMAAISPDDPAPGVCPPHTYQRLAGAAYLALGRHTEARAALTDAAARREPGKVRALVLGQLALACLGAGDTDAALHHVRFAIELAEATQSIGALAVAFRAGREIVRVCGGVEPEALEIVDQLLTVHAA